MSTQPEDDHDVASGALMPRFRHEDTFGQIYNVTTLAPESELVQGLVSLAYGLPGVSRKSWNNRSCPENAYDVT